MGLAEVASSHLEQKTLETDVFKKISPSSKNYCFCFCFRRLDLQVYLILSLFLCSNTNSLSHS